MTYQYEVGKEYKMRGGLVATILDVNFKVSHRRKIAGKIKIHNDELLITWQMDGTFEGKKQPHGYDLMPPARKALVNVYKNGSYHPSKKEADRSALPGRIGLLKITITGDEFEVEKVTI